MTRVCMVTNLHFDVVQGLEANPLDAIAAVLVGVKWIIPLGQETRFESLRRLRRVCFGETDVHVPSTLEVIHEVDCLMAPVPEIRSNALQKNRVCALSSLCG